MPTTSYHDSPGKAGEHELAFTYQPRPSDPTQGPIGWARADYRGFKIQRDRNYFLWEVYDTEDKTNIPEDLLGKFSNMKLVTAAIDKYLEKRTLKEKTRNDNKSTKRPIFDR